VSWSDSLLGGLVSLVILAGLALASWLGERRP
jgi:hypothetical protein